MSKLDEIKNRVGMRVHMKTLCNAPKLPDSIINMTYLNAEDDVIYLLSIIEQAEKTFKLIANGNNDFPTWEDTVDVLKDVRLVAREELNLFFRGN